MEVGVSFQRLRLGGGGARCWSAPACPGMCEAASTELAAACAARSRVGCCAACLVGGASSARAICFDDLRYSLCRSPGEALPPAWSSPCGLVQLWGGCRRIVRAPLCDC